MRSSIEIPRRVAEYIERFFAEPLKRDRHGQAHDISRSSLRYTEALILAALVRQERPIRSLEIGLADGGSCVAIAAARQELGLREPHVALDPFQETLTGGAGLLELSRLGLLEAVHWVPEFSEFHLSAMYQRGDTKVSFVFIDGDHNIGQKVTDAFYADRILTPGGVIVFHDCLLFSTAVAVRFLALEQAYRILTLAKDNALLTLLRSIRYVSNLGLWYCKFVIPKSHRSVVALRKPHGSPA